MLLQYFGRTLECLRIVPAGSPLSKIHYTTCYYTPLQATLHYSSLWIVPSTNFRARGASPHQQDFEPNLTQFMIQTFAIKSLQHEFHKGREP